MIRLVNHGPTADGYVQHYYSVYFNEPGWMDVSVSKHGIPHSFVYRGLDTGPENDPVGAYDGDLPDNENWYSGAGIDVP